MQYQDGTLRTQPQPGPHAHDLPAATLAEANINPATGLATDYLNHFNEVVMLLDMIPNSPDCRDDVLTWRPKSYVEHFASSGFSGRKLAIAVYETVDPARRAWLEGLIDSINVIIAEAQERLITAPAPTATRAIARHTAAQLRPLLCSTAAVINDTATRDDAAQAAIDILFMS